MIGNSSMCWPSYHQTCMFHICSEQSLKWARCLGSRKMAKKTKAPLLSYNPHCDSHSNQAYIFNLVVSFFRVCRTDNAGSARSVMETIYSLELFRGSLYVIICYSHCSVALQPFFHWTGCDAFEVVRIQLNWCRFIEKPCLMRKYWSDRSLQFHDDFSNDAQKFLIVAFPLTGI